MLWELVVYEYLLEYAQNNDDYACFVVYAAENGAFYLIMITKSGDANPVRDINGNMVGNIDREKVSEVAMQANTHFGVSREDANAMIDNLQKGND